MTVRRADLSDPRITPRRSGVNENGGELREGTGSTRTRVPVALSQRKAAPSDAGSVGPDVEFPERDVSDFLQTAPLLVMTHRPSGLNPTAPTQDGWPVRSWILTPVATSHR